MPRLMDGVTGCGVNGQVSTDRKRLAISALVENFRLPGISYNDRERFVSGQRGDLGGTGWVLELFRQVPKERWPLLFLHFEREIRNLSINPEKWVDLAVDTMRELVDLNDFEAFPEFEIGDERERVVLIICEITSAKAAERAFIAQVIQRAPDKFVPIMFFWQRACCELLPFQSGDDRQLATLQYNGDLSASLGEDSTRRVEFVQVVLMHYYRQCGEGHGRHLAGRFWEPPYLNSRVEVGAVFMFLQRQLQDQLIKNLVRGEIPHGPVARVLEGVTITYKNKSAVSGAVCWRSLFHLGVSTITTFPAEAADQLWKVLDFLFTYRVIDGVLPLGIGPDSETFIQALKPLLTPSNILALSSRQNVFSHIVFAVDLYRWLDRDWRTPLLAWVVDELVAQKQSQDNFHVDRVKNLLSIFFNVCEYRGSDAMSVELALLHVKLVEEFKSRGWFMPNSNMMGPQGLYVLIDMNRHYPIS